MNEADLSSSSLANNQAEYEIKPTQNDGFIVKKSPVRQLFVPNSDPHHVPLQSAPAQAEKKGVTIHVDERGLITIHPEMVEGQNPTTIVLDVSRQISRPPQDPGPSFLPPPFQVQHYPNNAGYDYGNTSYRELGIQGYVNSPSEMYYQQPRVGVPGSNNFMGPTGVTGNYHGTNYHGINFEPGYGRGFESYGQNPFANYGMPPVRDMNRPGYGRGGGCPQASAMPIYGRRGMGNPRTICDSTISNSATSGQRGYLTKNQTQNTLIDRPPWRR